MSQLFVSTIEAMFGCRHSNQSRPFTLRRRTYKVCLDCGKETPYSLVTMSPVRGRSAATKAAQETAQAGAL